VAALRRFGALLRALRFPSFLTFWGGEVLFSDVYPEVIELPQDQWTY